MARMPSSIRTLARALPAVVVALLALAVWATQSQAQAQWPGIEVTVATPEGDSQQAWLNEIKNPEISGRYWVRSAGGQATPIDIARGNGISLRQVFEQTATDLRYRTIKIQAPGGTIELSRTQVESPNYPPVFYLDEQGQVHFLVPSTGPTDYNSSRYFPVTDAAFRVTQTSSELEVKVKDVLKKLIDRRMMLTINSALDVMMAPTASRVAAIRLKAFAVALSSAGLRLSPLPGAAGARLN